MRLSGYFPLKIRSAFAMRSRAGGVTPASGYFIPSFSYFTSPMV